MQVIKSPSVLLKTFHKLARFNECPADNLSHGVSKPLVIIVPGFMVGSSEVTTLGDKLAEQVNVLYLRKLPRYNTNIELTAEYLAEVLMDPQYAEYEKVIIGHCMGGISAVEAIVRSQTKVKCLITAGTPFAGTPAFRSFRFLSLFGMSGERQINTPGGFAHDSFISGLTDRAISCILGSDSIAAPASQVPNTADAFFWKKIQLEQYKHSDMFTSHDKCEHFAELVLGLIQQESEQDVLECACV